jgi:hypothetical protein
MILDCEDLMTDGAPKGPKPSKSPRTTSDRSAKGAGQPATDAAEQEDIHRKAFEKRLMQAAGMSHLAASQMMVNQVAATAWRPEAYTTKEHQDASHNTLAQLLAYEPKDALEGMLVSQMIGTHNAAMECLRRAQLNNQTYEGRDMALKHAAKLTGIFTRQVEALDKHRNRGQQKITVEHVTVNAGGQAIVGGVDVGGGTQAHATPAQPLALTNDPGPLAPVIDQTNFVVVEPTLPQKKSHGG